MITKKIAGHELTLEEGQRYLATRPIAARRRINDQRFPISIALLTGTSQGLIRNTPELVIEGLTYDQANEFLREFNNGVTSFEGRIW